MRFRLAVALLLVLLPGMVVALGGSGTAGAETTTFTGTLPPQVGGCGPFHDFSIGPDTTVIDVVATADIPSNDIVLNLHHPQGTVVASQDTATSPEAVHYVVPPGGSGAYSIQVCFASNAAEIVEPTTYTVSVATSTAPVPAVTPPVVGGGTAGTPQPTRVKSDLVFSSATVVDAQRTEGEPVNVIAGGSDYWESGPFGTSTQQSWIHRSTDGGLEFHVVSPIGLRPDLPPGGGDTDLVVDDQGVAYFSDLEALASVGVAVSNDHGGTWRKNAISNTQVVEDRQWMAVDNGPTGAASDNTVFMVFRQIPAGSSIVSTPGSTGAADPVGGVAYVPASTLPLPVSSGAPCGQLKFDPVRRNLYLPCGEASHITIAVAHVDPGQRTGLVFHTVKTPDSPVGDDVSEIFPWLAVDRAGNLLATWIAGGNGGNNQLYYSASTDAGLTWTTPVQVSAPPSNSDTFPVAVGGAAGQFSLAWLGQESTLDSDLMPSWFNDPQGATKYPWYGYVATITGANTLAPTIAQQRFTAKPMHYGQICNSGTTCAATGGDRTMADYFDVNYDSAGRLRIVFNDTTTQYHGAHLMEIRQVAKRSDLAKTAVDDELADAQWPHYAPTGAGPNQAQLDFTKLALSQPDRATLRIQMSVADLTRPTPPPGKTQAVWLTRFLAKSVGTHGEEAYRVFYAGMRADGATPSFFAGSGEADNGTTPGNGCRSTSTPGSCKIELYPAEVPLQGRVAGNTITIDVPLQGGFGPNRPIQGALLYSVTGFTFGRDGDADLVYADVDATHAFDYVLARR
jgi:hypothetical protein